jgi:anti-sigma factor RsiW
MIHINEDKLLQYALEVSPTDAERAVIAEHLATCSECSARLEELRKDIEIIGGIQPRKQELRMPVPRPRHNHVYPIIRAAALFIFGIAVGFGASNWIHRQPAYISPAYLTLSPPPDSVSTQVVSDATEISKRYYEYVLEGHE